MEQAYTPIIGLEIHVELKTKSKMFCGCSANYHGAKPNTHCCPVCLGLPGALPVPNKKAIEWCVMLGMALECSIPSVSKFDRKNYFYPDLPKGYQISQYDQPFCVNGRLEINTNQPINIKKIIRIRRVHMEEDTGKLMHATVNGENCTLVDFNRSSVPLVEIVTEPDIRSSEEARVFLKKLRQIIRAVGISDADMEKGSMRLEPNISVLIVPNSKFQIPSDKEKYVANNLPSYKVEVKNINSFSFVKKAIDFEVKRHVGLLTNGETPKQETRGWDEKRSITYSQRSKEEAEEYRYFPEPDIPPIRWSESSLQDIRSKIPELPDVTIQRLISKEGLTIHDASVLVEDESLAALFLECVSIAKKEPFSKTHLTSKQIANWLINKKVDSTLPAPTIVKQIASSMVKIDNPEIIGTTVDLVLSENPKVIEEYKSGKTTVVMFLVGQVMRRIGKTADAQVVRTLLEGKLK